MSGSKKTRKKLKIGGLIFLLLCVYLIGMCGYYLVTMPVKSVSVTGNHLLTEAEVIKASGIVTKKTSMFKSTSRSIAKKVKGLPEVAEAKIKKSITGNITIEVVENKVLFYYDLNDEITLSDGSRITDNLDRFVGYPHLVNYVPSEVYEKFVEAFEKIDVNIIRMISEIEYSPDTYNDIVIDEERFLLRMNDGNFVYINNVNIEKLNKYQTIYASVGSGGVLYLDSSSDNYIFNPLGENEEPTEETPEEGTEEEVIEGD